MDRNNNNTDNNNDIDKNGNHNVRVCNSNDITASGINPNTFQCLVSDNEVVDIPDSPAEVTDKQTEGDVMGGHRLLRASQDEGVASNHLHVRESTVGSRCGELTDENNRDVDDNIIMSDASFVVECVTDESFPIETISDKMAIQEIAGVYSCSGAGVCANGESMGIEFDDCCNTNRTDASSKTIHESCIGASPSEEGISYFDKQKAELQRQVTVIKTPQNEEERLLNQNCDNIQLNDSPIPDNKDDASAVIENCDKVTSTQEMNPGTGCIHPSNDIGKCLLHTPITGSTANRANTGPLLLSYQSFRRRKSFHGPFLEPFELLFDPQRLRRTQSEKHLEDTLSCSSCSSSKSTTSQRPINPRVWFYFEDSESSSTLKDKLQGKSETSPQNDIAVPLCDNIPEPRSDGERCQHEANSANTNGDSDDTHPISGQRDQTPEHPSDEYEYCEHHCDSDQNQYHYHHHHHHHRRQQQRHSCSRIGDCLFSFGSWRKKKKKADHRRAKMVADGGQVTEDKSTLEQRCEAIRNSVSDVSDRAGRGGGGGEGRGGGGGDSSSYDQDTNEKGKLSTKTMKFQTESTDASTQDSGLSSLTKTVDSTTTMSSTASGARNSSSNASDDLSSKTSLDSFQFKDFLFRRAYSQKHRRTPSMDGISDDVEDQDQVTNLGLYKTGIGRHRRAFSLKKHFPGSIHNHHHHHHHQQQQQQQQHHHHLQNEHQIGNQSHQTNHHHHLSIKEHIMGFLEQHLHGSEPSPFVRTGSFNKHSLASVELSSWASRGSGRRGVTLAPFGSALSPTEVTSRTEILQAISSSIIHLFQRKPLKENELGSLQEHVRFLINAAAGALVSEYYKEQLLRKGMIILREKIKNEQGLDLLRMLSETWEYFFREILPSLQSVLYPLASILGQDESIRSLSLLAFRNIVVLKVSLKEALDSVDKALYPPGIKQMLLVLQGIQDNVFLSENQFLLEKLVARVVCPYLGQRGVYEGGPEPVIKVKLKPIPFNIPSTHQSGGERLQIHSHHFQPPNTKSIAGLPHASSGPDRNTSTPSYTKDIKKLNPVLERVAEGGRRHSVVS